MESSNPKTVDVKLQRAHTHQRKAYKMGDTIPVPKATADRLEKRGIAKRA